jgi:aryl-alcohol dehydrogenase-like predicted oxidoreductase
MERRRLGRTGHLSTVAIFGTAALGGVTQEQADRAMEEVLKYGVNHIDVAPSYGEAELRLGPWLERLRDRFFLGCKTYLRDKAGAAAELRRSLERLRVDRFDLYQLHAVTSLDELDQAMRPGGALEAILEAREEGLVRYIGITAHGHDAPVVLSVALSRFAFDTIMFPLNFVLYRNPDYRRDTEALLALAKERDVGVMIIKAIGKRPWGDRPQAYDTWYEPFDRQEEIDRALWFVLSQPVTAAASAGDVRLLPRFLDAASRFRRLSDTEQEELIASAAEFQSVFA